VHEKVSEKGDLNLRQIVLDFEGPVVKELKHVFGSHVRLTGCIVHFSRSQRKKQGEIGNLLAWQTKADFKIFCECLKALAYVPEKKVPDYFKCLLDDQLTSLLTSLDEDPEFKAELADVMKESLNKYIDYFERTYVGRAGRAAWLKGKFAIPLWNQYDNILEGRQISNNRHESFHSRLSKNLEKKPTLWSLLDELVDVEASVRGEREEHLAVDEPSTSTGGTRRKRDIRKANRDRIRTLVTRMEEFEMTDFLKRVGYFKGHL